VRFSHFDLLLLFPEPRSDRAAFFAMKEPLPCDPLSSSFLSRFVDSRPAAFSLSYVIGILVFFIKDS